MKLKIRKSAYSRKQNSKLLKKTVLNLLGIITFILGWYIILKIVTSKSGFEHFSGFLPLQTFKVFFSLLARRSFWSSVWASLFRIIFGLVFAALTGIPLGILIGYYKKLRHFTEIPINFVRMISPLAWMPIAIIILPGFQDAILFLISIASIWPIVLNTSYGVSNVNRDWIRMARNQGAKDYQLLFKIILPSSLPSILTGLRLALGIAWVVLVPAELLGISSGLGYLINDARDTMEYDRLTAMVLAIGLIGFLIDSFFQIIRAKYDWRKKG